MVARLARQGIKVTGVSKATLGLPEIVRTWVAAGVHSIGESRIESIESLSLPGVNYVGGSRQLRRRVGPPPPCHGRGVDRADGRGRLAGN